MSNGNIFVIFVVVLMGFILINDLGISVTSYIVHMLLLVPSIIVISNVFDKVDKIEKTIKELNNDK